MSLGGVAVLLVLGDADRTEAEQRGMRQRVAAAGGRCSINGNPPLPAVELSHIVSDGWDTFRRRAPSLARRYAGTDGPPPKRLHKLGSDFCHLVTQAWLTATLLAGEPQPESEFVMPPFGADAEPTGNTRTAAAAAAAAAVGLQRGHHHHHHHQQQRWCPHDGGDRAAKIQRIDPPAALIHTETVDDRLRVRLYRSFLSQGEADALFGCLCSSVERGGLGMGEDTRPQTGTPSRPACLLRHVLCSYCLHFQCVNCNRLTCPRDDM